MQKQVNNYLLLFLLYSLLSSAQTKLHTRVAPDGSSIEVKWYGPGLINTKGFDLYRKEENTDWKKINKSRIQLDSLKLNALNQDADKLVKAAAKLALQNPLESLSLITTALASFQSEKFCVAIGIFFRDSSLIAHRKYRYRLVSSENNQTQTESESPVLFTGEYKGEAAPQKIVFKVAKNKVHFSWLEESNRFYGVKINRRQSDSVKNICLTELPVLFAAGKVDKDSFINRFVDEVPIRGGTFYYTFYGLDFFGSLTKSSPSVAIRFPDLEPPPAPDNFRSQTQGRLIRLSWQQSSKCSDLKDYHLFRTTQNDTDYRKIKTIAANAESFSITDSVPFYQSYMYQLFSADKEGNQSNPIRLQVDVPDIQPPNAPEDISVRADSGKIILKWKKNSEKDLQGYIIYRSIDDTLSGNFVKMSPNPLSVNGFTDVLPANAKNNFIYKVVAVDKDLNRSAAGPIIACRLPDLTAPTPPFLVSAGIKKKMLVVEWLGNPEKDLLYYHLFIKTDDTLQAEQMLKMDRSSLSCTIEPKAGRYYWFTMLAMDSSGNASAFSNRASCNVPAPEKENRTPFMIEKRYEKKSHLLGISWKKKAFPDSVHFVVFRKLAGEVRFFPVTGILSVSSYSEAAPDQVMELQFQVRAYLQEGIVIKSNILTIKTHEKARKKED